MSESGEDWYIQRVTGRGRGGGCMGICAAQQGTRHLHISHNAPYLPQPPPPPPKFCIPFVFHLSWVLQLSQEKLKTMLMQNFLRQIRCIMGDVQVENCGSLLL